MANELSRSQARQGFGLGERLAELRVRIGGRLKLGLYSRSMRYGLRRDLAVAHERPSAKIPIAVRPVMPEDLPSLMPAMDTASDPQERREIAWRRAFVKKGARGGFVAVDLRSETPCYMQWLLGPSDNPFIRFLGGFPELGEQEALLENAYTPPKYRGLGIMSAAMALIAEHAKDIEARYVLTFVDQHNIASLKGCQRAGFHPHLLHHRTQACFGLFKHDLFEVFGDTDARRHAKF